MRRTSVATRAWLVAFTAIAGVASTPLAAHAHGDDGVFSGVEATAADAADPLTASVRARLVYANDGDPAAGATITVEALGPAAAVVVPLRDNGDGTYEGAVTVGAPGAWTLRFVATTPAATTETGFTAEPPPTTTAPRPVSARDRTDAADSDRGGGSSTALVVAVVAVLVLVAAGGTVAWSRRRAD